MNIFTHIENVHATTEGWCSLKKAHALAAIIISTQPETSLEIGVWYGKSLLPMALAHQYVGKGSVIAVDPWMAANSVAGQDNPADVEWWKRQEIHQAAYDTFKKSVYGLGLQNVVRIERKSSDDFEPPDGIGNLHIDANHGEQAITDFQRYAPKVKLGGFLVADDLNWTGGAILKAISMLPAMGFEEMYRVQNQSDNWAVFQRCKK